MNEMTNEQARDYFKKVGLSYEKIHEEDIWNLLAFVAGELAKAKDDPNVLQMSIVIKSVEINDSCAGLESAYFEVSGPYFDNREGISFNSDGFIGFAGWASSNNAAPFVNAFVAWCKATAEIIQKEVI